MIGTLLGIIALVGGTVHTGIGAPIENGTVIIDGDRIKAVGVGLPVPKDAQVIDAKGKVITAGFIESWTQLGLVEISADKLSRDDDPESSRRIRAAQQTIDGFNPYSPVLGVQRAHGITTIISTPQGGSISGRSAAFDVGWSDPVKTHVTMRANLGGRRDGTRGLSLQKLRELLEDTRAYAKNRRAFDQNAFRRVTTRRLDLEAMIPVTEGRLPLAVVIHRRSDIEGMIRFAKTEKVAVVLVGATEAWMVAEDLAAAQIPVVVDPSANLPRDLDRVHSREDAAAILDKAGVPVIISSFSTHNARKLRQWAGNAVRSGLPHASALAAITTRPATVFGLPDRGTVAPGQIANVVVWSGDPFELASQADQVLVRGAMAKGPHRQRALFDRYRRMPHRVDALR